MPDMMKIEYNTRIFQEAKSLKKKGYRVTLLGFSNKEKRFYRRINGIDCFSYYLEDRRSGIHKIYRYFTSLSMIFRITLFILKKKYDVYHAHNFHTLPASVISAKIHKAKVIYDTHESWTIHKAQKLHPEHIFAFIAEKIFLRFVDRFVTVNEFVREFYKEKFMIKDGVVLYNNHPLKPLKRIRIFHNELNLEPYKIIVLFQGGFWNKARGIKELIESAKYTDKRAVIVFLGFGSPDMLDKMNSLIRQHNLESKVFIIQPKPSDEILEFTMSADIGMNLINREGKAQDFQSPWKLFEYCMAGLAVVSTDLPFHQKVHKKYKIGPLVSRNNNPKNIALVVNDLIKEPEKLSLYKKNARKAAETEYNWENQEEKLLLLYKQLGV